MSVTKYKYNKRKRKIEKVKRQMKKKGFEFKKAIKNTLIFRHIETGKKERVTIES